MNELEARMATLFKRRHNAKLSVHWWASWKDHRGKFKSRTTGTADDKAALIVANKWESADLLCREGHVEHVAHPLLHCCKSMS
jgi:hypothetical protein